MQTGKLMMARAAQDGMPLNFIGAGAYEHHIPSAVWAVTTRGEFYSAYTPYQAEASQGTLQLIYEYQTMISSLTGMEVSNASLYDGGSAVAEASLMSVRAHRKSKSQRILVPTTVHPNYRKVAVATASGQGVRFEEIACPKGYLSVADLKKYEGEDITAIVIQQPNFFGVLEDVDAITDWAHANGAHGHRLGESHLARHPQAAGRVGHEGRRHRLRRLPAARRAAVVGRSVRGLPHHAAWNTCARCRAASWAAPSTPMVTRVSRSRCRRASSTSAAARPRRTSAPTRACWSRLPRSTSAC